MSRCAATKPNGTPCERIVGVSQTYCYSHDPANAGQRHQAASKAARAKGSGQVREVTNKLAKLADDVLGGTVDKATGSVVAQILGVLIRGIEQERKIREQDELEARLAVLEARYRQQGGGRRWG